MSALDTSADNGGGLRGMLRRTYAMLAKEFIQLRRDRVSFAMIIAIPVMQLLLFGYAINTNPHNLPTAVLVQEDSVFARQGTRGFVSPLLRFAGGGFECLQLAGSLLQRTHDALRCDPILDSKI